MHALRKALHENHEWLMERIMADVRPQGCARSTPSLAADWGASVAGLSAALEKDLEQREPSPGLAPEHEFDAGPAAVFAITEARRHREQGVAVGAFLGLLKQYRQAYLDLVAEKVSRGSRKRARDAVSRFFDRIEVGVVADWSAFGQVRQLEAANARLEKEIAQRAALEEALRQGAQFYRAIVEDQTEMVCRFTPDCVLTFVNRAYCRFWGKTEEELLGASFLPAIPGSHREAFLAHLRAITPHAPLRVVEHAATAADGSVRWQRWTDRGFFDADGNAVEYQSVGSDITDRRQAEEELKRLNAELEQRVQERTRAAEDKAASLELEIRSRMAAEERLRLACEAGAVQNRVAEAFLTVPGEKLYSRVLGVLLEATGSRYGAFGYLNQAGELVAPSMTEDVWTECRVREKTHRFPQDAWGGGLWALALREGRLQVKNAPCEVPDGHVPLSCALAAPILFQEAVIGLIVLANRPGGYTETEEGIMEDACRRIAPVLHARLRQEREEAVRRQAEAELRESRTILRQVLDSVPQAIFWKDTGSVYLGCNQAFASALGLSGPDQVVGRTDYDLPIPRADADAYRADDAQVVASNTPKLHILEQMQQADGARIWLDTSKTPLLDANQEVRGVLGVFEDITERKQAEEALRRSEAKYRDLFESMNEGACILDAVRGEAGEVADYRVVDVNPAYTAILGVPRERAAGCLVTELFGLSRAPDLEEYAKVLATGTPATFETAIPELGRNFHVSASRLGPDRFVALFQDISQRKRAEDALRRRLEMEQILAGVSSQLVGMRFNEVEGSLRELLGIVAEAIHADAGRVCAFDAGGENCLAFWSADGAAQVDDLCPGRQGGLLSWIMPRLNVFESVVIRRIADLADEAAHVRAALAQTGIQSLLAVPMAKGEDLIGCLAFMTMTAPRDWSSDDVAMIETLGNILANGLESARLERAMAYKERRYFDLIDNLAEGLLFVDRDGLIQLANKSMAQILGYEPDEIQGTAPQAYMTEEKGREFSRRFKERMQGKGEKYSFELVHKDGSRVYVHISASPVRDEQGAVVGSMSLVTDLTKERLLQLQLVQAQRLEAIGQLAAGIAHEINTPTQYVDNNTQFLRGAFEDLMAILREHEALLEKARGVPDLAGDVRRVEEVREERQAEALLGDIPGAFDDAGEGLQRISLIVNSVKRFAHPGGSMQPADLNDALRSTIVVARNEWKYVAEVATELDPGLPLVPCVLSDINQVALNLIVNAAQAIAAAPGRAPEEKGRITVRTRTEGGWAVIEVQDTGNGIPVDIRPRIFDPFFTTKEVGKGTGQGLAIARAVVAEKHHGIITFETEEGKGTTFSVRLPLVQNQGKDEP